MGQDRSDLDGGIRSPLKELCGVALRRKLVLSLVEFARKRLVLSRDTSDCEVQVRGGYLPFLRFS